MSSVIKIITDCVSIKNYLGRDENIGTVINLNCWTAIVLDKMFFGVFFFFFFFNPKVLIFFLFLHQNICYGYSEVPCLVLIQNFLTAKNAGWKIYHRC